MYSQFAGSLNAFWNAITMFFILIGTWIYSAHPHQQLYHWRSWWKKKLSWKDKKNRKLRIEKQQQLLLGLLQHGNTHAHTHTHAHMLLPINTHRSSGWQKLSSPRNLQEGTPPPSFAAIIKAEEQEYSGKTKYVHTILVSTDINCIPIFIFLVLFSTILKPTCIPRW